MLVYRDSCSTAGCHDGVPAWMAAHLQRYVQLLQSSARKTAEDQRPDGFESLFRGEKELRVSQDIIHTHEGALTLTQTLKHSVSFSLLPGEMAFPIYVPLS